MISALRFATLATLLVAAPASGKAQASDTTPVIARVPFDVGEKLVYDVKLGKLKVGQGTMEVLGLEEVRGIMSWHTRFRIRGGVAFYRVDDVLESWIDRERFHSLRFVQDLDEGGKTRERRYEIFPDRAVYRELDGEEHPSVSDPLDDGSFLYFVRSLPLEEGRSYEFNRYFRPDRNPVIVRVLKRETVNVPAGTFRTIVIQPVIKSKGIFSEKGEARIWLSDDERRIMVQMKTRTKIGSLNLFLRSVIPAVTGTR